MIVIETLLGLIAAYSGVLWLLVLIWWYFFCPDQDKEYRDAQLAAAVSGGGAILALGFLGLLLK